MEADQTGENPSPYAVEEAVRNLVDSANQAVVAALAHQGERHHEQAQRLNAAVRDFAHQLLDPQTRTVSLSEDTAAAIRHCDALHAFFTPRIVA